MGYERHSRSYFWQRFWIKMRWICLFRLNKEHPMKSISIIPHPQSLVPGEGRFTLAETTVLLTDEPNRRNAELLQSFLMTNTGFLLPINPPALPGRTCICLQKATSVLGVEGYSLSITPDRVQIYAETEAGVFYGLQTFFQLIPSCQEESGHISARIPCEIPCVQILDQPKFPWRGFMLDEGRHFHGMNTVTRLLDVMGFLKMNIFHWHLTEDQGWRIEIKKYPRLTEIGAFRPGTARSLMETLRNQHDGIPHGGFYTQEEICQIVAYAKKRHIHIVPEIEMPGHSLAALAAYPKLGCTGGPYRVATHFGIFKDVICPGKEETYSFLQDVLTEVLNLFPSQYLHIGGDETPTSRWKKCPDCQARMVKEGLTKERELQAYLTNRIADFLEEHNRILVGWNQILNPYLHPKAILQYWLGSQKEIIEALTQGWKVIFSPFFDYYLDHSYLLTPLSRVYHFQPFSKAPDTGDAQNILGVEAPLWTEFVPSWERLEYQVFPRLLAVAETGWTNPDHKDFRDFISRLEAILPHLRKMGIRCAARDDYEPRRYQRIFGLATIFQPQKRTIQPTSERKKV